MSDLLPPTEQRNPASRHLSELDALGVVNLMASEEYRVLQAVEQAGPQLAVAAGKVALSFLAGGRTIFIGAGTSGRIALQEVAELPPTFGVPESSFLVLAAGAPTAGLAAIADTEDDELAAPQSIARLCVGDHDVIVGLAASGATPFVRAGMKAAAQAGAWTCGIANNPGSPLLGDGDLGIVLDTGPEILTGSTRLKAGTAQKLALNRITTAAMVTAGRVVQNHMIDMHGSNQKFRRRSIRMLVDLTGVKPDSAEHLLRQTNWSVRRALEVHRAVLGDEFRLCAHANGAFTQPSDARSGLYVGHVGGRHRRCLCRPEGGWRRLALPIPRPGKQAIR
jgi:N-acetylmuramic acid 6-phosphate etherase